MPHAARSDVREMSEAAAAHTRLARLLATSGRTNPAERHCAAALAALEAIDFVAHWQLLFELALVQARLGSHSHAVALLRRAIAIEPAAPEVHSNLAAQLMIAGDLDGAQFHCEAALAIAPQYQEAHYNMNVLLRRAGRQQEAIERYWGLVEAEVGRSIRPSPTNDQSREDDRKHMQRSPPLADTAEGQDPMPSRRLAESSATSGMSVLCVKWGTKYGAEYVNKLFAALTRHAGGAALAIDFVCLTDDASGISTEHDNLRCVPLEPGWRGWWNKLQIFSPGVATQLRHDRCMFIDLDTVVVGSIAELLCWEIPRGEVALLRTDEMANEQRQGGYNSSIVMWRHERKPAVPPFQYVYGLLQDHFSTVSKFIHKFDHWLEMTLPRVIFLEDVFPGTIVEYKSLDETALTPPAKASIVCFPLQPKPHDAQAAWIQQHWC